MKSGTYKVSFEVELTDCENEESARLALFRMISDLMDDDEFPEVNFELTEELDMEYNTEDVVPELNF